MPSSHYLHSLSAFNFLRISLTTMQHIFTRLKNAALFMSTLEHQDITSLWSQNLLFFFKRVTLMSLVLIGGIGQATAQDSQQDINRDMIRSTLIDILKSEPNLFSEKGMRHQNSFDEKAARKWLIENPEIIQEAFVELERRQKMQQSAQRITALGEISDTLLNSDHQVVLGNPKGDITLVEFFDYNCGFCRKALHDLEKLIEHDSNLRIVIKEFPVLGEDSIAAARVAIAAAKQGNYLAFHQKLLGGKGRANRESALQAAHDSGLDVKQIEKDMKTQKGDDTIREVYEIADKLGLTGTPAYIVGDQVIMGAVGYDVLKKAIQKARDAKKG